MKPFDYENAPELFEIREYFKEKEWKAVCISCQKYDKDSNITKSTVKDWIKFQVNVPNIFIELKMNNFLYSLDTEFRYNHLSISEFKTMITKRLNK